MWCVLGLGNPGRRYAGTRHNLGFMVVDELAARSGARLRRGGGEPYDLVEVERAGTGVLLVKPTTYVNRSGIAAGAVLKGYALVPARLLVVVDDVYLPFGRLRLRPSGSAGGHKGLVSIEEQLSTREFPRLRIGVGAPGPVRDLAEHVLAGFSEAERRELGECIARAAEAVELVLELGVEGARPRIRTHPDRPAAGGEAGA